MTSNLKIEPSFFAEPPKRFAWVGLLLLGALLFFLNTWGYDLWPADEPRFGQVAREMMESGNLVAPQINGLPYKEKPPLLFWAITLASKPFGDVTEFSARAPSAVAALLILMLTYALGNRMYGRRVGLWAGLILATSVLFWWEARSVRTDMLLSAAMTVCLWSMWRWHETWRRHWLVIFYLALGAGLYAKGPAALVFPALLIVVFFRKNGKERARLHWPIGFAAALAMVLLWYIPARAALPAEDTAVVASGMGVGVWNEFVRQIIGRIFLGVSKAQWPWYYIANLPLTLFPWSLFLPWIVIWTWRHRKEDDKMRFLLSWVIPAFVFFSIMIGKRDVYILPVYPAVAIISARAILDLSDSGRVVWRRRTAAVWGMLLVLIGVGPFVLLFTEYRTLWSIKFAVLGVVALFLGASAIVQARRTESRSLHKEMAFDFAVLAVLLAAVLLPALDPIKGASDICRPLCELSERGANYRLYTVGFSREEYIFYSKHFHTPILNDLLPVQTSEHYSELEMAKRQRELRKAIAKAVDDVSVASLTNPTESEIETLRTAVHDAVGKAKVEPELASAFEASLRKAVGDFAKEFEHTMPAFVFIQEEDWKWLLPLFPDLAKHPIISRQAVGRREMLLIANQAGAALVKSVQ